MLKYLCCVLLLTGLFAYCTTPNGSPVVTEKPVAVYSQEDTILYDTNFDSVNFDRITTVILRERGLKSIPEEIFSMKNLTYLDVSFNEIAVIPENIAALQHLERFIFLGNKVKRLPAGISNLPALKGIYFNYNRFDSIPECLCALNHLNEIIAHNNNIKTVPDCFKGTMAISLINNPVDTLNIARVRQKNPGLHIYTGFRKE